MFATLLLVRLIRKSRQAEEAFRFYSSFKATQCFKNLLCLIEIKEVFCKKFNEAILRLRSGLNVTNTPLCLYPSFCV